jgi:gamma-glutamyltranspeptidase/glutathione hydrolase
MNVLSGYPLGQFGAGSVKAVHYTIEAERRAYADRNTYLGDPDFIDNKLPSLLSARYADAIRKAIDPVRATPSLDVAPGLGGIPVPTEEGQHTTHYSVIDRWGNAVAVTYTINSYFGAGVIAGDTGFFLNNEMDDFTSKPGVPNQFGLVQGAANAIEPGKRPLSSMSPTIVEDAGNQLQLILGAPGGSRIPTAVLGVIQNVVDYDMSLEDAVAAPRIHHQFLPDTVYLEPNALDPAVIATLEFDGYQFSQPNWTSLFMPRTWGLVEAIQADRVTGVIHGASDKRRPDGAALARLIQRIAAIQERRLCKALI